MQPLRMNDVLKIWVLKLNTIRHESILYEFIIYQVSLTFGTCQFLYFQCIYGITYIIWCNEFGFTHTLKRPSPSLIIYFIIFFKNFALFQMKLELKVIFLPFELALTLKYCGKIQICLLLCSFTFLQVYS